MKTNVIFLLERDENSVFAYFPDDGQSYSHVGQHSPCSPLYAKLCAAATPAQYGPLQKELEGLGYNLEIKALADYFEKQSRDLPFYQEVIETIKTTQDNKWLSPADPWGKFLIVMTQKNTIKSMSDDLHGRVRVDDLITDLKYAVNEMTNALKALNKYEK